MLKVLNLQPGAESKSMYCPSPNRNFMIANKTHLLDEARTSRYASLYSGSRNDYDNLPIRKETYIFYPPSDVPTWAIADAGFYFTGNHDISRCFRCGLEIKLLRLGEDPLEIHRRLSKNCPFVKEKTESQMQHLDSSDSDSEEDCINGFSLDIDSSDDSSLEERPKKAPPRKASRRKTSSDSSSDDDSFWEELPKKELSRKTLSNSSDHWDCGSAESCSSSELIDLREVDAPKPINVEELRKENARLKLEVTCIKCHSAKVQTLFLPCRHLVVCEACGEPMNDCIHCNAKILGTVRTFFI